MGGIEQEFIAKTNRLSIRPLRLNDEDAIYRILSDADVMRYSDGIQTRSQVQQWLRTQIEDNYPKLGFGIWAIEERTTLEAIGYCGLTRDPHRCGPTETEIGYRLIHDYWGRGFATEAVCAVRDYAINSLHLATLIAIIHPENRPSIRVIEKAGFTFDGEIMFDGYTHPDKVFVLRPSNR
jgi:RimJ/RimL family protein N-acetyltransferase